MPAKKKAKAKPKKKVWGFPLPIALGNQNSLAAKAKKASEDQNARYHKWGTAGESFWLRFVAFREMPFTSDATGKQQIFHQFRKLEPDPEDSSQFRDIGVLISTQFSLLDYLYEKVVTEYRINPCDILVLIEWLRYDPHPTISTRKVHVVNISGFVANEDGGIGLLTLTGKGDKCHFELPSQVIEVTVEEEVEDDVPF